MAIISDDNFSDLTKEFDRQSSIVPKSFDIKIPYSFYKKNVSSGAKMLWGILDYFCTEKGYCALTNELLSKHLSTSSKTIDRYLSNLSNELLIDRKTIQQEFRKIRKITLIVCE